MTLAPDRGDGRKAHYGEGKQPLDTLVELGFGPGFCAGNVIKYLRRDKSPEHSLESAKFYFRFLMQRVNDVEWSEAWLTLCDELTRDELEKVAL